MPRLRWMFAAALATLFFLIAATVYYFEFQRLTRLNSVVAERSARLAEVEHNVRKYREKVAFYKTEEGVIHLAREQHNLIFPGERVFVVKREYSDASRR